jgi:adenylate cyclase
MSGAEVHANLIANMITGATLRELPRSGPLALVIGVSVLAAALMSHWHPARSALVAIGLSTAVAGGCWYLFRQGVWLPATAGVAAPFLAYLAQGGRAFFEEQARRKAIRTAFARYVPPAVVDEISAHPERLQLNGERRELTVMFTDLAGFTTISESLSAEEVANLLNRHFSDMTEIVMRHAGTVDKFIGDAVMAFWGAPIADPKQSLHALDAALEMQRKMAEVRADVLAAGGPRLSMRIGLHRGECIVGNMGGAHRFEYTAVGDTVNLASRLEGVNKIYGTGILLSENVRLAIEGDRSVRPVDCVTVKGRREPVMLYTPCDDDALREATQAALAAYRDGDWDRSREIWERMAQSHPDDPLAALFVARLGEWRDREPPPAWNGITLIDSK